MAAIAFPSSPSVNDIFTSGNRRWKWTGTRWAVVATLISPSRLSGEGAEVGDVLSWDGEEFSPVPITIPVSSVNTKTGSVVLTSADVGAAPRPSASVYVNAGVNDIQSGIDSAAAGQVVHVSSGSFGGSTVEIAGKQNIAIIAPPRGQGAICELSNGRALTLASTSTGSISIANLQIEGLTTLAGSGNNYFTNLQCQGGITISAGATGNYFFDACEIAGAVTVPATFAGVLVFGRCNMAGATFALSNSSPLQVQFALCTNLPATRPTNATFGTANSDTTLQVTTNTKFLRGPANSTGTAGQMLYSGGAEGIYWGPSPIPAAPTTGTHTLKAIEGVLTWVAD
jgi:hypothetical protein